MKNQLQQLFAFLQPYLQELALAEFNAAVPVLEKFHKDVEQIISNWISAKLGAK
jgi:hypothetical protein